MFQEFFQEEGGNFPPCLNWKKVDQKIKKLKKRLAFYSGVLYNTTCRKRESECKGLSPNGKATDSDSVISRFESL